jgi:hypothetical protein
VREATAQVNDTAHAMVDSLNRLIAPKKTRLGAT